jgi:signal transduction histidine kinase
LGLAIVKQIVELHGGTVELLANDGQGTIARLELPAEPAR